MDGQFDTEAYYHVAYDKHTIMNPLRDDRLHMLARYGELTPSSTLLDIGSGNGYASLILTEGWNVRSVQVDISEKWTKRARAMFEARGMADQAEIHCLDASQFAIEPSRYSAILCLGTALIYGGFEAALRQLRPGLAENGLLIIGESGKEKTLPKRYRDYLEEQRWDVLSSRRLLESIDRQGFEVLFALRSTTEEWDKYMGLQWTAISNYARLKPDDDEAQQWLAWAQDEQEVYLRYQRHYVDWNIFMLRALS